MRARIHVTLVAHLRRHQMFLFASHGLPKFQQNLNVVQQLVLALARTQLGTAKIVQRMTVDSFAQYVASQRLWNGVALQQRQTALQQLESAPDRVDASILSTVLDDGQTFVQQQTKHFHFVGVTVLGRVHHFGDELQPNGVRCHRNRFRHQIAAVVRGQRAGQLNLFGEQADFLFECRLPSVDHFLDEAQFKILAGGQHPLPTFDGRLNG